MRITLHYLIMGIIIPLYAIRVCPFVEKLNEIDVFITILSLLGLAFLARTFLLRRQDQSKPLGLSNQLFLIEFGVLLAAGCLFGIYNTIIHEFPLVSGVKVLVGFIAMGLFAAMDSALALERDIAAKVKEEGLVLTIDDNFTPLTAKLVVGASAFVILNVSIFLLLLAKDLDWIIEVAGKTPLESAKTSIIKEFLFVLVISLLETINLIFSFSRNIKLFLHNENDVLAKVAEGVYESRVPVSTQNEFGVMASKTNEMIQQIINRNSELNKTREVTILTLASLAETRDNETGAHILRTQRYVKALAVHLQQHNQHGYRLTDEIIDLLYKSAPLHDIGKVGIPDAILLKPGKLTNDEFEIMKQHPKIGADALKVAEDRLGGNSFLTIAGIISLTHHEKWDGNGYPNGLAGENIPLPGRLMAVADVYDALISKRVYKDAFSHEKSMSIIKQDKGKHFDPVIVDALVAIENEFIQIAGEFSDASYASPENMKARA